MSKVLAAQWQDLVHPHDVETATKIWSEAVASGAQSYLAHYYYAYALSREGTREDGYRMGGYAPETAKEMREALGGIGAAGGGSGETSSARL